MADCPISSEFRESCKKNKLRETKSNEDHDASVPLLQEHSIQGSVSVICSENEARYKSMCGKCLFILSTLRIEPIIFVFMFTYLLNMSCITNMLMEKGCLYSLNHSSNVCQHLPSYPEIKAQVEILGNDYSMYIKLTSFVGAIAMIFIAPWSDKYGRKLPLLLAHVGLLLTDLGIIYCVISFDTRLEYLIIVQMPKELCGGFICILTIVYSLASESSSDKTRTLKYTFVEIGFGLGIALGGLTGGLLYKYYGYFEVYATSAGMHFLCLPWIMLVVKETRGLEDDTPWKKKIADFFNFNSLTEGFKSCIRPRENKGRTEVWLMLISMCTIVLMYESYGSIAYVYVHHIYNWDLTTFQELVTAVSLSNLVVLLVTVPLLVRVYKFGDPVLGIIGIISMIAKNVFVAFAKYHNYIYYLGNTVGVFSGFCTLAIRSRLSKIITKDELGCVFSFLATCEALIPLLGTVLITKLFNATIDIFPSISYLVTAYVLLFPLVSFVWQYQRTRKSPLPNLENASINSSESVKP